MNSVGAAALATGLHSPTSVGDLQAPPKLVRQRNRLGWYNELCLNGFVVLSPNVVRAFDKTVVVGGEEIECPAGSLILINSALVKDE